MRSRIFVSICSLATLIVAPMYAQTPKAAAKAKSWAVPRTADGHPDLQGTWTNATLTPLERPARFAGKSTVSDGGSARRTRHSDLTTNDIDNPEAPLLARADRARARTPWAGITTCSSIADRSWRAWTAGSAPR